MIATLSLALLLGAPSQDLNQKLDYEAAGISATRVVEELTQRTGVRLAATPQVGSNPMVIKVKGVTLRDLMDRMGQALEATWSPDTDGTLRLVAVPVKDDAAKRLAERIARFTAYQAKVRKELGSAKPFDRTAADNLIREIESFISTAGNSETGKWHEQGEKIGNQGPMNMLAKRILIELDPRALALVTGRGKTTWSSRPTRMQLPLAAKAMDAVRAFAKDYDTWTAAVGSRTFTYPRDRGLPTSLYYLVQNNFDWNDSIDLTPTANDLTKVLVFARSWSGEGARQIEVKLVDKRGKYVAQASASIDLDGGAEERVNRNPMADALKVTDPNEPDVVLKPVSAEIAQRFAAMMGGPGGGLSDPQPLSKEADFALHNPEKVDPVSIGFPEFAFAIHEHKKLNIVASPPDFLGFYSLAMTHQGIKKASQFMRMMSSEIFGGKFVEKDGWLVLGSRFSESAQLPADLARRMNRPALGQLLRSIKQDGMARIDPLADFAYRVIVDESEGYPLEFVYLSLMGGMQEMAGMSMNGPWLRLYGSMDADQRRAARAGRLPVGSLRPDQRKMLESHVFGAENYSMQYSPKGDGENQDWDLFHNGVLGEPTERFPTGLPANAFVSLKDETEDVVMARGTSKWGPTNQQLTAVELASHLVSVEMPMRDMGDWEPPQYTSFELQSRRQVHVRVDLDPEVSTTGTLNESKSIAKTVNSLDQLPEPFKTKFLAEKAKQIEQRRKWQEHVPPPQKK